MPLLPIRILCASASLVLLVALAGCTHDVVTQHNNVFRTGEYLAETNLTPGNVVLTAVSDFRKLYTRNVDGAIYSQPLYVHDVNTPGGSKNLFFITTENNWVYAFDADDRSASAAPVFQRQLRAAGGSSVCGETYSGRVGITGTPVIDTSAHSMYVVARDANDQQHYLHKLDIANNFNDLVSPVLIGGTDPSGIRFNGICERNRPGLLLVQGVVYVGFGTFSCDAGCPGGEPYHGWVVGYHASDLSPAAIFCTSPQGWGSGIWQTGGGLVSDGSYVYFETGNGPPPLGDSFVKLQITNSWPGLTLAGSYTPVNAANLVNGDTDLGSGGPALLPDGRLVGGGKQGRYYVINTSGMTLAQDPSPHPPGLFDGFQAFTNTYHNNSANPACGPAPPAAGCNVSASPACFIDVSNYGDGELCGPNIHSSPVFWSAAGNQYGAVYQMPEKDYLKAFRYTLTTDHLDETPYLTSAVRPVDGMPGGFSSLSANGGKNGILWTSMPLGDAQWTPVPGRIVAFDASNLTELWHDDGGYTFAKSVPPTIAEGKVFRATASGVVVVYGLVRPRWYDLSHYFKPNPPPYPEPDGTHAIGDLVRRYGGTNGVLGDPEGDVHELRVPGGGYAQDFKKTMVLTHHTTVSMHPAPLSRIPTCSTPPKAGEGTAVESSIYWSPKTGAHWVAGEIRALWLKQGGANGSLGFPSSDEGPTSDGEGRMSHFEHGDMVWYAEKGVSMQMTAGGQEPMKR